MYYKCRECGHIFESGEASVKNQSAGEHFGTPVSESFGYCPICGGEYEEEKPCEVCGGVGVKLHSGVCENCIDSFRSNAAEVFYLLDEDTDYEEEISVNPVILRALSPNEISAALRQAFLKVLASGRNVDCSSIIDADIDAFAERMKERVNNRW